MNAFKMTLAMAAGLAAGAALAAPQDQTTSGGYVAQEAPTGTGATMLPNPWYVAAAGGVEAYAGSLGSRIQPGPTYGAALGFQPNRVLGAELGYSGAVYNLAPGPIGGPVPNSPGVNLSRDGFYLLATPGYSVPLNPDETSNLKPYILGGVGFDDYTTHGGTNAYGYMTKMVGTAPVGGGVQLRMGHLTADVRGTYAWDFGTSFTNVSASPQRYQGEVLLGGNF